MKSKATVLITGGSGFLGRALIDELMGSDPVIRAREIRIFDIEPPRGIDDSRVKFIRGTITDGDAMTRAFQGADVVFHMASKVDWGSLGWKDLYPVNVQGTRGVVDACRQAGVKALVYTSSMDAVVGYGSRGNCNEDVPYPRRFANAYCRSKATAERIVKKANGWDLRTISLRPGAIWGEGDPYNLKPHFDRAAKGLYCRLGSGWGKQQGLYVRNGAHAHLLAARSLLEGGRESAGHIYFITDARPENYFLFVERVLQRAGLMEEKMRIRRVPMGLIMTAAAAVEGAARVVNLFGSWRPLLSRYAVHHICGDFTFDSRRAHRDFGFVPKYGLEQAIDRTAFWFRDRLKLIPSGSRLQSVLGG